MTDKHIVGPSLYDLENLIDSLSPLALDAFFELNTFDDDEGGYRTLAQISTALGKPEGEVEAALAELLPHDLADLSDDLLTTEGKPFGTGYARFEDGERLLNIYSTLQHHENSFFARHKSTPPVAGEIEALRERVRELEGFSAKYGQHISGCSLRARMGQFCVCGFNDARQSLNNGGST